MGLVLVAGAAEGAEGGFRDRTGGPRLHRCLVQAEKEALVLAAPGQGSTKRVIRAKNHAG